MSTIPFFTTIPMSMISPMNDIVSRGTCVIKRPRKTPEKAKGTENMMTKGSTRLSNCAAITMKTSIMIRSISVVRSPKVSCWLS